MTDDLVAMWGTYSALHIADYLTVKYRKTSRNAVIGKAHRLIGRDRLLPNRGYRARSVPAS